MAFKGHLQDMSLHHLIDYLRIGPKSGMISLTGECECGIIYVLWGRVIDAIVIHNTDHTIVSKGEEAMIHMYTWQNASFFFRQTDSVVHHPVRVERDEEELEEEAFQRMHAISSNAPDTMLTIDTPLQLTPLPPEGPEAKIPLNATEWRIIGLLSCGRHHTLRTICPIARIDVKTALTMVSRLISIGLVELAATESVDHELIAA